MARRDEDELARIAHCRHVEAGKPFALAGVDPASKPLSSGSKADDKARVAALAEELDKLQNLFHADRRFSLLVVLQGIDTSGKDGTLRGVFGRMSPLGVQTTAWGPPTDEERRHDFLWRIHARTPARGEVALFNRSHYEDVLVPFVQGAIDEAECDRRYQQINDFERLLAEQHCVVCKFMLHISKDEQRRRLQARIDDPAKRWKFRRDDLTVRRQWDAYQHAYQRAISATATPWAPWTVVPADSKTHRNIVVALVVRDALRRLGLRYPDDDPTLDGLVVE
jgi:PPK2 family polyphosphate:nucleotide phosphotransferase